MTPDVSFVDVETASRIALVAELAEAIWTEHFTPIIGSDQVRYMLSLFQSEAAIAGQIAEGYRYVIITVDREPVGYFAVVHAAATRELRLSKFYVRSAHRRKGAGRAALDRVEQIARELSAEIVRLTVNKNNRIAIGAYERLGFHRAGSMIQDIGGGFVMDDYEMLKRL